MFHGGRVKPSKAESVAGYLHGIIFLLGIIVLGCTAQDSESIKLISLNERERMLLEANGASSYFAYEVFIEPKYTQIDS